MLKPVKVIERKLNVARGFKDQESSCVANQNGNDTKLLTRHLYNPSQDHLCILSLPPGRAHVGISGRHRQRLYWRQGDSNLTETKPSPRADSYESLSPIAAYDSFAKSAQPKAARRKSLQACSAYFISTKCYKRKKSYCLLKRNPSPPHNGLFPNRWFLQCGSAGTVVALLCRFFSKWLSTCLHQSYGPTSAIFLWRRTGLEDKDAAWFTLTKIDPCGPGRSQSITLLPLFCTTKLNNGLC